MKVIKDEITYGELVNYVEKYHFGRRIDVIYFLVGFCKAVTEAELDMVERLYVDGFIEL